MATLYLTDGSKREVSPANGTAFSLGELQELIEGWVETVLMPDGQHIMVIDEEGKLHHRDLNRYATHISGLLPDDYIVGPALLCTWDEIHTKEVARDGS